jgi:hypothetical protein
MNPIHQFLPFRRLLAQPLERFRAIPHAVERQQALQL